jgi:nucleotide-binding universal stress UspA family protein
VTFATILVGVDFAAAAEARIGVAVELAARFNALLIGVAGWPLCKESAATARDATLPVGGQWSDENVLLQLQRLGDKFRALASSAPHGVEWRSSTGFPREVIANEARAADLVVIGQDELPGDVARTYDPGTIILTAGRPVLVVPQGVSHLSASRVLIAWKDTREARRAVRDALPFLQKAASVAIATANPGKSTGTDAQVADVARYLARHDVKIDKQIATVADQEEGDILLRLAEDNGIDLVVAGAYGRSRLSEWMFGGVTRHLLTNSTVPCLFSN